MAALEEFYDDETWAAIEGWGRRTATAGSRNQVVRPRPVAGPDRLIVAPGAEESVGGDSDADSLIGEDAGSRGPGHCDPTDVIGEPAGHKAVRVRAAGAVMAGALFVGVGEVLEPPKAEPDEEFRPELDDTRLRPVSYFHSPGFPEESVAVIRPWLF